MVVTGNPPYSEQSVNKGAWMMDLMEDYKKRVEWQRKIKKA